MFQADFITLGILITALHSPSFQQRQAATASLEQQGERAEAHLVAACASSDPEVRMRAERLLGRLLPGKLERLFARHHADGGVPWADSLGWPHAKHRQLYCEYANDPRVPEQAKLEEQKHYPTYRAITRLWIIDSVYSGAMSLPEAERTLAGMAARHPLWAHGKWMDEASEE